MNHTTLSNQGFDLPAFLLDKVYGYMDDDEIKSFSPADARDIAHDLGLQGIEADADEVYEIIVELIAQDKEGTL